MVTGNVLDQAGCNAGDAKQSFTFGDAGSSPAPKPAATPVTTPTTASTSTPDPVVDGNSATPVSASTPTEAQQPSTTSQAPEQDANPTGDAVPVARAGGVLNPEAAAEANVRDDTATRAFSSVSLKSSSGQCLFIDPEAGDFRQNLIPVQLKDCDGSANEKFDIITAGKHNDQPNSILVVSTTVSNFPSTKVLTSPLIWFLLQTQGCLNFDPRRAAGDTVVLFSCGGRADGGV